MAFGELFRSQASLEHIKKVVENDMRIELDDRLKMLTELVPACDVAADVGTDHGFLGAWLLENKRCRKMQFLDISAQSLQKARDLIEDMQLEARSVFSVGDGLAALTEDAQTVIIAGMGGLTIAGIIERGRERLKGARLIMQPNVGIRELRERLTKEGFRIADERLTRTGGRWYVGIAAEEGEASYTDREMLIGPILLQNKPSELKEYARFRINVTQKAYDGAVKGSKDEMTRQLEFELNAWKEVYSWL